MLYAAQRSAPATATATIPSSPASSSPAPSSDVDAAVDLDIDADILSNSPDPAQTSLHRFFSRVARPRAQALSDEEAVVAC
jgi:hypothetical protein